MTRTTRNSSPKPLLAFLTFSTITILAGCSGAGYSGGTTQTPPPPTTTSIALQGSVHHGGRTIAGARVYLFGVNTTGYGSASVSLLNAASAGHSDSLGAYVLSDASGNFGLPGDWACPSTAQAYLYAAGGTNAASGLLAALGPCPDPSDTAAPPSFFVNEVTTVATAYGLAGFATDATHMAHSNTPLARTGAANAMLNVKNLVNPATGVALATTPEGNGTVPQAELNTLANMLAACGRTSGANSSECSTLFNAAVNANGVAASDTATAAINIAHAPANAVASLYGLAGVGPEFSPRLTNAPPDFTLALRFTDPGLPSNGNLTMSIDGAGSVWIPNESSTTITKLSSTGKVLSTTGGFVSSGLTTHPVAIAIDGSGNAWIPNNSTIPYVVELSNSGDILSPSAGYTASSFKDPVAVALDSNGAAWIANADGASLTKLASVGVPLSPPDGYTGGGLQRPVAIAIDGLGNIWTGNLGTDSVSKFSPSGAALSPATGFTGGGLDGPESIAIDSSNTVWVSNYMNGSVTKLSNAGTPASVNGFTGGGLVNPIGIAIDGAGTAWVANQFGTVTHLSATGAAISPAAGFIVSGPPLVVDAMALDGSGNVWLSGDSAVVELIGASAPVVTPLPYGIANNALGTRP
ncbi:MAG TPA: NHL repeat-containing protein [Acidobacteriaceae bacterium]|nr:NHL repeat-containing protein [Acidobacteriaceae bacterium]